MRVGILLIVLITFGPAYGQQFPFEVWHAGKTVLDTGDTLQGNLKYDLQTDILQVQINGKLESFTARKVLYFEIFDVTAKRYRMFYSLPYAATGKYKAPVFFELLAEGELTVLCREALEYRTTSSPLYYYGSFTRLVLVNKYFILKPNGDIEEFRGKKNDWYELMRDKQNEVEQFTRSNKLDFDEKYELLRIVEHYNSLFNRVN